VDYIGCSHLSGKLPLGLCWAELSVLYGIPAHSAESHFQEFGAHELNRFLTIV
jgi:hypothetical protein